MANVKIIVITCLMTLFTCAPTARAAAHEKMPVRRDRDRANHVSIDEATPMTREQKEEATLSADANVYVRRSSQPKRRVAIVLRGESFRAQIWGFSRTPVQQIGHHKRRHCEDDSFDTQQKIARDLMRGVQNMEEDLGLAVDLFGATYACQNGRDYATQLQSMYKFNMQNFQILPKTRNSSQLSTMTEGLRMPLQSGIEYDAIYLARWDFKYPFFESFSKPGCLLETEPQDCTFFGGFGGCTNDGLFYVPGKFAKRMLSFMEEGRREGGCCQGDCGMNCNWCILNFAKSLGLARDYEKGKKPWKFRMKPASRCAPKSQLEIGDWGPTRDEAEERDNECIKDRFGKSSDTEVVADMKKSKK